MVKENKKIFIHAVLFEILPGQVKKYHQDNLMWAHFARRAKGFISYQTARRLAYKNQYASVYRWKSKGHHNRFMHKYHDWLVARSKAKVKVLGYFNLKVVDVLG
jgi:heme-degrading monooxygenase HmoA